MSPADRASSHFVYAFPVLFSDPALSLKHASQAVELSREIGDKELLAKALSSSGNAQLSLGQYDRAEASYEESAAIYDELGSERAVLIRANLANVLINASEQQLDRAKTLLEAALTGAQRAGKKGLEGILLGNMAQLAYMQGRKDDAYTLSRRSVEIARTLGARQQEAVWLYWLGIYSTELGRRDEAASVLREALTICRDILADDPEHVTGCLESVLMFAASDGRLLDAARIHGFIESFRRDRGLPRAPALQTRYDNVVSGVRTGLGDTEFANSAASGSRRTPLELLEEAVAIIAPEPT
jgi:tetratricopeptide (TPR) repeat protein